MFVTIPSKTFITYFFELIFGNDASSLDSEIRKMLKILMISIRLSSLFVTEFIFKWPIIFVVGYSRRCSLIFKKSLSSNVLFKERVLERVPVLSRRFRH